MKNEFSHKNLGQLEVAFDTFSKTLDVFIPRGTVLLTALL